MENLAQSWLFFVSKTVRIAVLCLPAVLFTAGLACSTSNSTPAPSAKAAETAKGKHFVCPMHPEVISTDEGNCPQCGMKLVPGKAE